MSNVISIEDMKQRILKPRGRNALNANQTNPTSAQTPVDGSRGTSHGAMESGTVAHQTGTAFRFPAATTVSPSQGFYGGVTPLRIPKPSELFGIHTGRMRQPAAPAASPAPGAAIGPLQPASAGSGVSSLLRLPSPGVLSAPSATRRKEHDRRLRAITTKLQRANQKRRLDAAVGGGDVSGPVTHPNRGGSRALDAAGHGQPPGAPLMYMDLTGNDDDAPTPGFLGLLSGLRRWLTSPSSSDTPVGPHPVDIEQDAGVHLEFDTDVVDALVYTVGRWMGLDTEQLRDSPGLRTLVSRNIQWFRNSPDWMKLLGLVMAKKLNHTLDCPKRSASDTQRMLLDRMIMQQQPQPIGIVTSRDTGNAEALETSVEAGQSEPLPPPHSDVPVKTKKTKKRSPSQVEATEASPPPAKRSKKEKQPSTTSKPRNTKAKPAAMDVDAGVTKAPPSKKRSRSLSAKSRHPTVVVPSEPASLNAESAVPPQADPLLCPPSLLLTPLDPALGVVIADDASRCDSSGDIPMATTDPVFYEDTQGIQPPIAVH